MPDPCNGFCVPTTTGATTGNCSAYCTWGNIFSCGFDGAGQADAGCLYATVTAPDPGNSDARICRQLCDCNDDCSAPGDYCAALDFPELEPLWQRAGYCRPLAADFTEQDSLSCGSAAGAGGI